MSPKILVIEDNFDIRGGILDILEISGYESRGAKNGREGVEIARHYIPDLILCDVMMPEMDGYDVLLEIQSSPATATIPFIFLTALGSHDDIRKGMAMGADDYLVKPFKADELLFAIKRRLAKRALLIQEATHELDELRRYMNLSLPHELRTPLTGVKGYLDILLLDLDHLDKERVRGMLERMSVSVERLYRLVENYSTYASFVALQQSPETLALIESASQCNEAGELIELIAGLISTKYKRPNDLQIEVGNVPLKVYPDHFKKAIYEVVDNAFKFSDTGQPVSIRSWREANYYLIAIEDQGIGMSPKEVSQIAPNRQFNREKHEQQGNGLGLAITVEVMKLCKGWLEIQGDTGQGLRVMLGFPIYTTGE